MEKGLLIDPKVFITLLFFSLLLFLADSSNVLYVPKLALQYITVPIQFGLYQSGQGFIKQFEFISQARRASQEYKAAQTQIAEILTENALLTKKLEEAQTLLGQNQALNPQLFKLISTHPIGITRYLYIDRGSSDGLKNGHIVVYKDNYIGKIIEISPKKSQVILPSDSDSKISAFATSELGKTKGILVGEFGSQMVLDKILHEEQIQVGDLVYTAGGEMEIPRGLILGQVSEVIQQDNEVFKQAKVKPLFDVSDLDMMFVVVN